MARRYSPDELNEILQGAQRDAAKPAPITSAHVGAQLAQAAIAGAGAALLVGGGMWLLGAPLEPLLNTALTAGVLVLGAGLAVRAFPADRMATFRRIQQVQRFVVEAEFRKREAYRAIERLEAEHADKVTELQRALDRMTAERDNAILEKKRAVDQLQAETARNFVRASNTEAQTVMDAHEILRFWFDSSEAKWFSRAVANSFGWSDKRHKAAQQLLVDSGVVVINEKRPRVMVRPLDAAIRSLNDHVARVESVYISNVRPAVWEEEE